jgi:hypothetical protein
VSLWRFVNQTLSDGFGQASIRRRRAGRLKSGGQRQHHQTPYRKPPFARQRDLIQVEAGHRQSAGDAGKRRAGESLGNGCYRLSLSINLNGL